MALEQILWRDVAPKPMLFRDRLANLTRPKCPHCGQRAMVCRYTVPASYNEPSPRYFECSSCSARYMRMQFGPWQDASGSEFAACYATSQS